MIAHYPTMIAQYTDRQFVNLFYGGLRLGSAQANASSFEHLM